MKFELGSGNIWFWDSSTRNQDFFLCSLKHTMGSILNIYTKMYKDIHTSSACCLATLHNAIQTDSPLWKIPLSEVFRFNTSRLHIDELSLQKKRTLGLQCSLTYAWTHIFCLNCDRIVKLGGTYVHPHFSGFLLLNL